MAEQKVVLHRDSPGRYVTDDGYRVERYGTDGWLITYPGYGNVIVQSWARTLLVARVRIARQRVRDAE